jgi:hypothetical protein
MKENTKRIYDKVVYAKHCRNKSRNLNVIVVAAGKTALRAMN